jgi:hypothetical protein
MTKWEYCAVEVVLYHDGSEPDTVRELLFIRKPGAARTSITNALGSVGLLNQLGKEGWELVDVESGTFYLKRPIKSKARSPAM